MKFGYYYNDRSVAHNEGLTPVELAEIQLKETNAGELIKSSIGTMLTSVSNAIDDELAKIERARVKLCRGNGQAIWDIVASRQIIKDLEAAKPVIESELKELF